MKSFKMWFKLTLILIIQIKNISMEPAWYDTHDGRRFLIDTDKQYNWYQAWNECARYDAQLVAIESEEKNMVLIKLLRNINEKVKNLWIGGNVLYEKMSFNWAVNEQDFTFTNWDPDEVAKFGIKKQCVYLMKHKKNMPWNFINCDAKEFGFICEEMSMSEEVASTESMERKKDESPKGSSMYDGNIYGLIG